MTRRRFPCTMAGGIAALIAVCFSINDNPSAVAGQVWLKNGTVLRGKAYALETLSKTKPIGTSGEIRTKPFCMIDDVTKKYYVPYRHVALGGDQEDLSKYQTFTLPQRRTNSRNTLTQIGRFVAITPFDEFGRRTVTFASGSERISIQQGITLIHPRHITVTGLNCVWEHGIAPTSIPHDILDRMIRQVTDQENPDDRIAIARFYLQAGMYSESLDELSAILRDFPDWRDRVAQMELQARELFAKRILQELQDRQAAGQHHLVYEKAKEFPFEKLSASVLRDVRELVQGYVRRRDKAEKALVSLGELQARLKDADLRDAVKPLRMTLMEQLDLESLSRLDAFLLFADDDTVPVSERLSLAYSGWLLGSANALSDLNATLRLWEARHLILQYLQADGAAVRQRLFTQLTRIEGINTKTVSELIPRLPPIIETPHLATGRGLTFPLTLPEPASEESAESDRKPPSYGALLPYGYTPNHDYPTIVALHGVGRTPEQELTWWGGTAENPLQAQRHGFIVIAPEYPSPDQTKYEYDVQTHQIVLAALRDARKRFSIDSDHVYLTGHGMGGDAAFDIGMSHPDVFAGVIPISGISDKYCMYHRRNGKHTAWYVVVGELDRDVFERNVRDLGDMMKQRYDVILAEYVGRGYETYYEEIHQFFDWMKRHTREKYVKEAEFKTLRLTGNHFFWMACEGLPTSVANSPLAGGKERLNRPLSVSLRVSVGNTVRVNAGADRVTVWLSPDLVDFNERVTVYVNGNRKIRDFLRPDIETMLEDFRVRGDRQKLYSVRLDFK